MVYHYMARNKVCKARIRSLKAKLKRALKRWKEREGLQILAEASLAQHNALWRRLSPNFKKFGELFAFLEILAQKIEFSALCAAPPGACFLWEPPNEKKSAFLDLAWKNMLSYKWPRNLDRFLALKKVKNTQKMTSLPLFWHKRSTVGRTNFWRGKWRKNWEVLLRLESIQEYLSNKHTWSECGHQESLQKWVQIGTTHRESGAVHRGNLAQFDQECSVFCLAFASLTFSHAWFQFCDVI